jgi:excisionase family DNA binding protein
MHIEHDKPLYSLTVREYIALNKQLFSELNIREQAKLKTIPLDEKNDILINEASEVTGLAVSTIRTKCHLNEMPYNKPAGTKLLRFKRDELKEWMASNKIKTNAEAEQDVNDYLLSKGKKK